MKALVSLVAIALVPLSAPCQTPDQVRESLERAVSFYADEVATHGGFVYLYSSDLTLRQAEGIPDKDTIWIQPPGTPFVGEAFLDAWEATGSDQALEAAKRAAQALVLTQLHSGGWHYRAHFDPAGRKQFAYRRTPDGSLSKSPVPNAERTGAGGWPVWRQRKYGPQNQTIQDDDVTQAALRFLVRMDTALKFQDAAIHDAAEYGLSAVAGVQYPNGGWSGNWDRYPLHGSPSEADFPVKAASYPDDWSRTWTRDFNGCYVTNDNLHARCMDLMLVAWRAYEEPRYLEAARRAGEFLLLAQMPDPQPVWAQAYDVNMHPVWDRAFEPPAVSGRESQYLCKALFQLYRATGDERFLDSADRALQYLKKCRLPDGTLPRFRELRTDRPIYFQRGPGGKGHVLSYEPERLASNYGFLVESILYDVERELRLLRAQGVQASSADGTEDLAERVKKVMAAQDSRGAWTEPGTIRDAEGRKVDPPGGIIQSETFGRNVRVLVEYLGGVSEALTPTTQAFPKVQKGEMQGVLPGKRQ